MRRDDEELSAGQIVLWTVVGIGAGLAAGFALSEWVGGVNRPRMRRAAASIRHRGPAPLTAAAASRAVEAALAADPQLTGLGLRSVAGRQGTIELHGWVPTRAARAIAGRVALSVPGIDRIVNSILVRGEDDRPSTDIEQITDQSA